MTEQATIIGVASIANAFAPLVAAFVYSAVFGTVGVLIALYNQWRYRASTISADQAQVIKDAAANEAAKIVAGASTAFFGNAKITVTNPLVAEAAQNILGADSANLKAALEATGATPGLVASLVTGEIGKLQARIVAGAPIVVPTLQTSAPQAPAAS